MKASINVTNASYPVDPFLKLVQIYGNLLIAMNPILL